MLAAYQGHRELIELFLHNGADINYRNKDGSTALIYATYQKHAECARILIDNKADVAVKDSKGASAIYWAKKHKMDDIVDIISKLSI